MHDVVILALKGLAGGSLVVAFALLSQALSPKRFAGLFSAAPAVAVAGLVIALLDKGPAQARAETHGMIAGALAMVLYALVVVSRLHRHRASRAAFTTLAVWLAAAAAIAVPVLGT